VRVGVRVMVRVRVGVGVRVMVGWVGVGGWGWGNGNGWVARHVLRREGEGVGVRVEEHGVDVPRDQPAEQGADPIGLAPRIAQVRHHLVLRVAQPHCRDIPR